MKVKFKKLKEFAIIPARQTSGAAGFDLHVIDGGGIAPREIRWFHTEIAAAIPPGYVGMVRIRSSLAKKYSLEVVAGTIDSDYRGEIIIGIINHGDYGHNILAGERIAQMVVVPCVLDSEEVEDLDSTERGSGGFGSTGK